MKILILSSKLPYPPKDGGALATLNLAMGLADSGMDVTMLAINTKKHFYDPEKIPFQIASKIRIIAIYKDTTIRSLSVIRNLLFSNTPYIAERFFFRGYQLELEKVLQQHLFDIIQMEGPYFYPYIALIRQNSTAKICLRAHNIEHKIWNQRWKNETGVLKQRYLKNMASRIKKLELSLIQQVDMVAAISDTDAKYFQQVINAPTTITIPAGIDLSAYKTSPVLTENSLFFLGSLDWMPNQEGLLWFVQEIFPYLPEYNPKLLFHVAGRNAPDDFLDAIGHPQIIYHGEVENAIAFMNKHRIMAVPLLTGSGIRIKIIEGMALGKCIVTTSAGAEGIGARDGEELLIANDAKQFAEKLIEVLENKQKAISISDAARKFIHKNFDNFAIASKLHDLYKSIL